jgi:hypothetical protein
MSDERVDIPLGCRGFDEANHEIRREIAKSLVERFVAGAAPPMSLDDSNKEWTNSIRSRLKAICPSRCYMRPPDPTSSKGEFLVDFTWEEKDLGQRVLLAGESEWGTDQYGGNPQWGLVEHDFEKLLSVKSPYKALIFSSDYELEGAGGSRAGDFSIQFATARLGESLKNYWHHLAGEVYVFVDFPRNSRTKHGAYRSFVWQAEKFGDAAEVLIEPLLAGNLKPR